METQQTQNNIINFNYIYIVCIEPTYLPLIYLVFFIIIFFFRLNYLFANTIHNNELEVQCIKSVAKWGMEKDIL